MTLSRRRFTAAAAALPLTVAARRPGDDDLTLVLTSDLHSGYRWSSRLLQAVAQAVAAARGPALIVVNGDVFERNNVIARRNDGAIDLALIRAFAALAPTLVTIGNHDSDLFDPRRFATEIARTGAVLIGDVIDPRTGAAYGPPAHTVTLRTGATVAFAALGCPNLAVYPPDRRGCYAVPDPAHYAATRLPALLQGAALPVVLQHAGFVADRTMLLYLPPNALLHGAHDHLRFTQKLGNRMHLQSGAWSSAFQVATIRFEGATPRIRVRDVVLDERSPRDVALQRLIDQQAERWLHPEDRAVIGHLPHALPLEQAVRTSADQMRRATDTDLALLSHTTFGDGLPAGAVTAFDKAAFLRFDGRLAIGEIDRDRMPALLARLNQFDGRTDYARRTGDYLHSSTPRPLPEGRAVKVAVNAYAVSTPANRIALFGWDVPGFAVSATAPTLSQTVDASIACAT